MVATRDMCLVALLTPGSSNVFVYLYLCTCVWVIVFVYVYFCLGLHERVREQGWLLAPTTTSNALRVINTGGFTGL